MRETAFVLLWSDVYASTIIPSFFPISRNSQLTTHNSPLVCDPELRYIKQIKQRNAPIQFAEDNIIVCRLEKPTNFPRFHIVELAHERTHTLRALDDPGYNREKLIDQCHQLTKIGWPQRKIADHLNISLTTVNRYLSEPGATATESPDHELDASIKIREPFPPGF